MESTKKSEGSEFWNSNPCGSSNTWEVAQDLRYRYTDPYLVRLLAGDYLRNRNVLEIGCGLGLDAERIVQVCSSYTGIDLSDVSVRIAKREVESRKPPYVQTKFMVADAESLPFEYASFDAVYSIGVLHHTPDFNAALAEIHRVLEPGGRLIFMLYRSFNPLWVVLKIVRGTVKIPVIGSLVKSRVLASERKKLVNEETIVGTAMLELFGCPVIDTYTFHGIKRRFHGRFSIREHSFHRVGIEQVIRILPRGFRAFWPQLVTKKLENFFRHRLGFYMVIIADRI